MAQGLFQMSRVPASNLARDRIITTFHLDSDAIEGPTDWQNLANDAAALFASTLGGINGYTGFECRVYRHGGAKNDPPEATAFAATVGTEAPGPHEVALCLSYYADFNAPRRRGRMYIGPWGNLSERPSEGQQITLRTLANGLSALGGVNVQWVQYSPTTGEFHNVTNFFIDNEWDTQRRRGLRATSRLTGTVSG